MELERTNIAGDGGGGLPPLEAESGVGGHLYQPSSRRGRGRPNFITSASTDEEEEGIRTITRSVKRAHNSPIYGEYQTQRFWLCHENGLIDSSNDTLQPIRSQLPFTVDLDKPG